MSPEEFWTNRRVLVTGCTGFLGSWLTRVLVARGASVVGLVRDELRPPLWLGTDTAQRIVIVNGELEDYALLERVVNEYEIESVFHLAAQAIVGVANTNPISTFETNIRGTWNLLEACRRTPGVRRIVVASSDKAYGQHERLPYTEDMPLRGRFPYDVSKGCADLISQAYFATYKLPVCITRCGNLFGGGDLNYSRIVPGTIQSVLLGQRPIIRSNGKFLRDYIYVREAVQAYLLVAQKMDDPTVLGEAFNFGCDQPLGVLVLVERILALMGHTGLPPEIQDRAQAEIPNQYLSSAKARKVLGWSTSWTLDQALGETIDWYRTHYAAKV